MIYESQYYGIVNTGPELMHHGIKGQRWGVRRFQYEDGSYTQAGLERYKKAESSYKDRKRELKNAKHEYKFGRASERDIYVAKNNLRKSKEDLKLANRKLKDDVKRDQGREMYRRGKTIERNERQEMAARGAVSMALVGSSYAFLHYGQPLVNSLRYRRKLTGTPVSSIAAGAALTGSLAAAAVLGGKYEYENSRMRTYWHNRGKQG